MRFRKQEIETVRDMIIFGHEALVAAYLEDRVIPIYVYLTWAETAKEYQHWSILQMLHNHQKQTRLTKFNKPVMGRK